ncbi:TolC family protein [Brevibacillus agri]|uniref:TolC family protein n=1 Tax=Brevibacillus TaxID=55080 RepID=UPI000271655B|nr:MULTISPECIES: TolC family protein [Brevibacillus]EJL46577.1 outer membrane protein [Brevibacillus sp. CF112]MBG9567871.1 membrane protein [Brevibacillus agri]MED1641968.1 TolC family protein [Brevibacillus agri]MED1655169.1 TolC family protein [Brevibacillus agri]MED1687861.1 TolC family protein [Brevibacillus agri]
MNFPYSSNKWMSISLAAVLTTAIGAGTLTASANTGTEAAKPAQPAQTVAAETGNTTTSETAALEELTLEKAIEQALQTNNTLQNARIDAKNADLNESLSYITSADMSKDMIDSLEGTKEQLNAAKAKYVGNAQAEINKKLNALMVKATESKIRLGAQNVYYNLIFAQDDYELKKQSLTRAETQLKVAKAAFDVGTKAKTDVLQAEMGVAGAKAALTSAANAVEVARMDLNDFLGVDLNKKWKIVSSNKQVAPISLTLEQAQAQALSKRVEMTKVQEELNLAELNVKLIEEYSALSTLQGRQARNNVDKSKMAIEEQKRTISKEVAQAYLNLNAAREAIEFQKTAKNSAAESYRLTNLRFENGLATTLEVIQAEEELSDRENQYQKAILNYNLAVVNFETALGN